MIGSANFGLAALREAEAERKHVPLQGFPAVAGQNCTARYGQGLFLFHTALQLHCLDEHNSELCSGKLTYGARLLIHDPNRQTPPPKLDNFTPINPIMANNSPPSSSPHTISHPLQPGSMDDISINGVPFDLDFIYHPHPIPYIYSNYLDTLSPDTPQKMPIQSRLSSFSPSNTPSSATQPQRTGKQPSNPSMVLPCPDGRQ
ncbi:uncharacterized protein MELLADRAFT_61769 [Melampsora larici-populina 98AG31]|uniref:Uncharacterized protein n=1 Tax=Melampsora larici-populina (strain 98AG31 / pathotype 3-4-7) TaxID=747676 RepID=F4RGD1_MELLP|nr:uncharacterized protein MELLADRAFT_61769 [Melampsora larici-populina 98AG31]EGG08483.1 hypothetical protein MELLADRAFT_61769 [Melampsora larici-populina 98AG31]